MCRSEVRSGYESLVYDSSGCSRRVFSPDTTKDSPYELKSSKQKGGDTDEEIVISESTMNIIMDCS
jgi:hypothetical protein